MLGIFVSWPLLALAPAGLLFAFARWSRGRLAWLAASAWVVYAVYEMLMQRRVLCSGECDIRIDLLGIYPALAALSFAALIAGIVRVRRARPQEISSPRPNEH